MLVSGIDISEAASVMPNQPDIDMSVPTRLSRPQPRSGGRDEGDDVTGGQPAPQLLERRHRV